VSVELGYGRRNTGVAPAKLPGKHGLFLPPYLGAGAPIQELADVLALQPAARVDEQIRLTPGAKGAGPPKGQRAHVPRGQRARRLVKAHLPQARPVLAIGDQQRASRTILTCDHHFIGAVALEVRRQRPQPATAIAHTATRPTP